MHILTAAIFTRIYGLLICDENNGTMALSLQFLIRRLVPGVTFCLRGIISFCIEDTYLTHYMRSAVIIRILYLPFAFASHANIIHKQHSRHIAIISTMIPTTTTRYANLFKRI